MLEGIINIYKEKGYTSHDVVARARGILRERKIGHTGTLDPEAEGVLPLCIGKATKVVPYLTDADKCYEAEVILGGYTTTEDATGEIIETFPVSVTKEQALEVIASFQGDYEQIPPMYSAIKVNGVRLYELARRGIVVDRPKRTVKIYSCEMLEWYDDNRFKIRVACSKGTYIRTLCTDIGKKLECGAYMGKLLRTKVGRYTLEDSITLEQLQENVDHVADYIHSLEDMFMIYPAVYTKEEACKWLYNGNKIDESKTVHEGHALEDGLVRMYDMDKNFIGLYKLENHYFTVEKMFRTL
ncbi:MAG: tRNA pseudouridine(55) synthase TruB [Cellulosilyticaceae bacterium]